MTLGFPNPARSFDTGKNRICFWGHDKIMEVSFFVGADTLHGLSPQSGTSETELLDAFDGSVDRIHDVAHKIYNRGKKGAYAYLLEAADF